ncbi:MAG: hypothetical protein ABIN89_06300 [Chitinophagaceae bacterium]
MGYYLGIRDQAMLAVYYGYGLRLIEGTSLELNDLRTCSRLLHVRKGKHYTESLVTIAGKNYEELKFQFKSNVITQWLKQNNLRQVQYMAGHNYISSTQRYQPSNIDELQREVQQHHPMK